MDQGGSAVEGISAVDHLQHDLISVLPARLVGDERGGRRIVGAARRDDAHRPAGGRSGLGEGLQRLSLRIDADRAIPGLFARRERGPGRRGVGHVPVGGPGHADACHRELGETEGLDADIPFQRREIHLRHEDMVGPHSVADEIEDILGLRGLEADGDQQDAEAGKDLFHMRPKLIISAKILAFPQNK